MCRMYSLFIQSEKRSNYFCDRYRVQDPPLGALKGVMNMSILNVLKIVLLLYVH
jgi:hypothetical protein